MSWWVAQVRSSQEVRTCERLKEAGLRGFCPRERVTQRRAIRRVGLSGHSRGRTLHRVVTTEVPLFAGYVFVKACDYDALRHVRGIEGVLRAGERPRAVGEAHMAALLDSADADGIVSDTDLTRLSLGFRGRVGDIFEFLDGPVAGLPGVITDLTRLDSHGMVGAEFVIFGRASMVSVPYQSVGDIVRNADGPRTAAAVG